MPWIKIKGIIAEFDSNPQFTRQSKFPSMSFFKKIWGGQEEKPKAPTGKVPVLIPVEYPDPEALMDLLAFYGPQAMIQQRLMGKYIGEGTWQFNMGKGEISFGPDLAVPIQILGTFSKESGTWLWGWANEKAGIPEALLKDVTQLREWGKQWGIEELTTPSFEAWQLLEHHFGMIAAGLFGAEGYYLADYGNGVLVALLKDPRIPRGGQMDAPFMVSAFMEFLATFEVEHAMALNYFLQVHGFIVTGKDTEIMGTRGAQRIVANLDEHGLIADIKAEGS